MEVSGVLGIKRFACIILRYEGIRPRASIAISQNWRASVRCSCVSSETTRSPKPLHLTCSNTDNPPLSRIQCSSLLHDASNTGMGFRFFECLHYDRPLCVAHMIIHMYIYILYTTCFVSLLTWRPHVSLQYISSSALRLDVSCWLSNGATSGALCALWWLQQSARAWRFDAKHDGCKTDKSVCRLFLHILRAHRWCE